MKLSDPQALERIEAAVKEAERGTAGEIVVVIAPSSGTWSGARAAFALATATIAGIAVSRLVELHAGWMAIVVPALFVVGWFVGAIPPIARAIAGAAALDEGVLRAAKVAFLDHGVHATKTRAGVLVYLSLFERRVQVLGDARVHALIGDAGWRAYAERISGAMKKHDVDELIGVVREAGAMLARSFPRASADENELPDRVQLARR